MRLAVVLLLLQSMFVFAEEKAVTIDPTLLGKIDKEMIDNIKPTTPTPEANAPVTDSEEKSAFSFTCKDAAGKEYKKGDIGYDNCLTEVQLQNDLNRGGTNNNSVGAGVNFKFGN